MLPSRIAPSMMCADLDRLSGLLGTFRDNGIGFLHIDVMDGVFVDNFCLGTEYCRKLRTMTDIPLDLHLMITEPEKKLGWFDIQPGEQAAVHAEATRHLQKALACIREYGARPAAAINPATPLSVLDYVLDDLDTVLLMTVNPGFAGQKLIPAMLNKITECRRYLDGRGHPEIAIEVDGNVSFENARRMREAGADIFVAGTSSVFCSSETAENIKHMYDILNG